MRFSNYFNKSIKRQLIVAVVITHAILMSIFIYDMVSKQKQFLYDQSIQQTKSLATTLSKNAYSWILANDYVGMEEIIVSISTYPNLEYSMLVNRELKVLAHSDESLVNKYLTDEKSLKLLQNQKTKILISNEKIVDIAVPIYQNTNLIGWARIALNNSKLEEGINYITFRGTLYALLAILIGWFFAYLMAKKLTKSLYNIMDVTKEITNGNWNERVKSITKDEFSVVTQNINSMLDELENKEKSIIAINENLQVSEFRWKFALEGNGDGLWDWELESNSVYFSPQWKAILGYIDHEIENSFSEWEKRVHPDDLQNALTELEDYLSGKSDGYQVEIRMFHKNGNTIWILSKGVIVERDKENNPLRIIGTHTNITETKELRLKLESLNKNLEEKVNEQTNELKQINKYLQEKVDEQIQHIRQNDTLLLEQSKMATMGEMIGNIAHQWRQPLSSISIAASSIDFEKDNNTLTDEKLKAYSQKIVDQTQYLSQTIDTFRNFLRKNKEKEEYIICEEVENSVKLIEASLKSNYIDLIIENKCDNNLKFFMVKNEFSQVIINIFNNAKDVLKEKSDIEQKWIKLSTSSDENNFYCTVEDNGGGIPENIINRVFEPYFTTKHKSQGTGLGLHMSYQIIVESLGGKLYVQNTKNGAKFFIELPLNH